MKLIRILWNTHGHSPASDSSEHTRHPELPEYWLLPVSDLVPVPAQLQLPLLRMKMPAGSSQKFSISKRTLPVSPPNLPLFFEPQSSVYQMQLPVFLSVKMNLKKPYPESVPESK